MRKNFESNSRNPKNTVKIIFQKALANSKIFEFKFKFWKKSPTGNSRLGGTSQPQPGLRFWALFQPGWGFGWEPCLHFLSLMPALAELSIIGSSSQQAVIMRDRLLAVPSFPALTRFKCRNDHWLTEDHLLLSRMRLVELTFDDAEKFENF